MQRGQVQLQGIPFPYAEREQGASIELMKFDQNDNQKVTNWADENSFEGDRQWGIIARSRTKHESAYLSLAFRRYQSTRLKLTGERVERITEESTEPEIGEFHFRNDGILELYSYGAKQRTALSKSFTETFGKDSLRRLYLQKDAMKSLMTEAIEVSSVSLCGLGNPFFSEATLSGTDPMNSKTFKEMATAGEIKAFRAKFASGDNANHSSLVVTIHSSCKVRFFSSHTPVAQVEIEDFAKRISDIAMEVSDV